MDILITTLSGFEKQAIAELEEILGKGSIKTTYFKGLLLGKTSLNKRRLLELLGEARTDYVSRVMPVDKIVPTNIREMKEFFKGYEVDRRAAVRCIRRGSHDFSSKDVEVEIGSLIKERGGVIDLTNPEVIFLINIIQDYACLSVLSPGEIIEKRPKVKRRWRKGERPVSRAELKMRELMERCPEIFKEDFTALDIGAAPGGWTRAMAERMKRVIAVDRAELDEDVKHMENVLYVKTRAEELQLEEKVDVITNDANILPLDSAKLTLGLAKRFLKEGGFLIHTVKLGIVPKIGKPAAKSLNLAVREVRQEFERYGIRILRTIKLKHNTKNEKTIVGRI